jgi:hypothetical protein
MTIDNPGGRSPEGSAESLVTVIPDTLTARLVDMSQASAVSPVYRIGDGKNSRELVSNGLRTFFWRLVGNEEQMAPIGGWEELNPYINRTENRGYILFPDGTRNARSILSGMEAYEGEKAAVVEAASGYLQRAKAVLGEEDTSFSWGSVAVTVEHKIYVAPPHGSVANPAAEEIERWKAATIGELDLLLQGEEHDQALVATFREELG